MLCLVCFSHPLTSGGWPQINWGKTRWTLHQWPLCFGGSFQAMACVIIPGTRGTVLLGSVERNELASLPQLPFVLLLVCLYVQVMADEELVGRLVEGLYLSEAKKTHSLWVVLRCGEQRSMLQYMPVTFVAKQQITVVVRECASTWC